MKKFLAGKPTPASVENGNDETNVESERKSVKVETEGANRDSETGSIEKKQKSSKEKKKVLAKNTKSVGVPRPGRLVKSNRYPKRAASYYESAMEVLPDNCAIENSFTTFVKETEVRSATQNADEMTFPELIQEFNGPGSVLPKLRKRSPGKKKRGRGKKKKTKRR